MLLHALMFWLPVPVTIATLIAWRQMSGDWSLVVVAVLLPLIYGYVMPFIGINILRNWQFLGGWRIGGMYVHHGFMYASKLSLFGLVPLLILPKDLPAVVFYTVFLLVTTLLYTATAWLQDHLSFSFGMVVVPKTGGKLNVNLYAPLCFSLIGLLYSAGLMLCHHMYQQGHLTMSFAFEVIIVQFLLMLILPGLMFKFVTRYNR